MQRLGSREKVARVRGESIKSVSPGLFEMPAATALPTISE
jgi:hypothetical protein